MDDVVQRVPGAGLLLATGGRGDWRAKQSKASLWTGGAGEFVDAMSGEGDGLPAEGGLVLGQVTVA